MIQKQLYIEMAIQALSRGLSDTRPEIRAKAAESLGKLGDETALYALINHLLTETDTTVRFNIIQALGEIGSGTEALKVFFPFVSIPLETIRGFLKVE